VRAFPPRDKLPILTFALESIEILNDRGLSSEDLLALATLSKIASVSGIFLSGFTFCVFLNGNLTD